MTGLLAFGPVHPVDLVGHGEHAVERGLERAGKLGRHHFGVAAVVAEDREAGGFFVDADHVAQFHHAARAGQGVGRDRRGEEAFVHHPVGLVAFDDQRDRQAAFAPVGIAHGLAAVQQGQRVEHVLFLHAEEVEIVGRDRRAQAAGLGAEAVVDVDDEGHGLERLADAGGGGAAGFGVGAVDLGQKGRDHRRAGGRFHDLEAGAFGHVQRREPFAQVKRDVMAGAVAVGLRQQVDRDFAQLGLCAQVVVADEAVEVEGRGRAGMGLDDGHFGQGKDHIGHVAGHAVRRLDRGAFGQVDDDRKLGLVVEGQKLDGHVAGVKRGERPEGQDHGDQKEAQGCGPWSSAAAGRRRYRRGPASRRDGRRARRHGRARTCRRDRRS